MSSWSHQLLLLNVFGNAPYVDVWQSNHGSGRSHVISSWRLAESSAYGWLFENGRMTQIGECQQVDRSRQMRQRGWKLAWLFASWRRARWADIMRITVDFWLEHNHWPMERGMLDFSLTVLYTPVSPLCSWYGSWSEASVIDEVLGEYAWNVLCK